MKLRDLFKSTPKAKAVQTSNQQSHPFHGWLGYQPLSTPDLKLYDAMREGIPLIDAALDKIVRLTGGFRVVCSDSTKQKALDQFVATVPVGATASGLNQFISVYLDSLLTYGNAVGEIVLDQKGQEIVALYNANLENIQLKECDNPLEAVICTRGNNAEFSPVPHPQLILFTPLNPPAGEMRGVSLLRSLPFVSSILMKIFHSTSNNFERIGNLRYAVTYNPSGSSVDRAHAKDIADSLAEQWSDVMSSNHQGNIKDFVAVGDVEIKVIGADNQIINTEVPVRQMLEQIIAKLGIPPFMLGIHWSTTERMSAQQADILSNELSSYRMLLEGVITRICETFLRLNGWGSSVHIEWSPLNLHDQLELANVRLLNAQAANLEQQMEGGKDESFEN